MVLYTHSNTYEKESPIQLLQNKKPGTKTKPVHKIVSISILHLALACGNI